MSLSEPLPFVAEPPGDLTDCRRAAEAAAHAWGLSEPRLMRSGMNALFEAGDEVVLRVGRPTAPPKQAFWLAAELARQGVRTATFVRPNPFHVGPLSVFALGRLESSGPVDWRDVGAMIAGVQRLDPDVVARHYPLPWCGSFPWWQFTRLLDDIDDLLEPVARRAIAATVEANIHRLVRGDMAPASSVVNHGDVHPGNVIQTVDGPVIIDWDLLCSGPHAWDHAALLTWTDRWGGERGVYEAFAEGFGVDLSDDPLARSLATLRLVAATLMRLRAGRTNPAAAAEAQRRLAFWRGEPDAPQWSAQ